MADHAPHQAQGGAADAGQSAADARGPGLEESLRAINAARREAFGASRGTVRALRRLVSADFALARSAFGRGLAWAGAAIVFGATAWLLLTGTLIALMQRGGLSWVQSLALAALLSLAAAAFAAWRVARYFDYMGMHATRRQLSRLGLFDEDGRADHEDDAVPPGDAPRAAGAASTDAAPAGPVPGAG